MKISITLVLVLLTFAGFIQARIVPGGYLNDDESVIMKNHARLFASAAPQRLTSSVPSAAEIVCKWLVNVTDWVDAVKLLWDAVVRSVANDLGKTPRPAPPAPRASPGSRP